MVDKNICGKSFSSKSEKSFWQPTASIAALRLRAGLLAKIRAFFAARGILEVETPLLTASATTDANLHSFCVDDKFYLQTSPEFAMKRLLAAGSGSIYQICKAFRDKEFGRLHRPEFTLLEWYRVDFDHRHLMDEMEEFLHCILQTSPAERFSYKEIFEQYLGIDPHSVSMHDLKKCALRQRIAISTDLANVNDRDVWLQLLLSHCIEPNLGLTRPTFIYDYPASQAALARIGEKTKPSVAERFEVYLSGIELANGFHELADAKEQRRRFEDDLVKRRALNLSMIPIDENLLAALDHGLPNCAGVALGLDRLMLLVARAKSLDRVISFAEV